MMADEVPRPRRRAAARVTSVRRIGLLSDLAYVLALIAFSRRILRNSNSGWEVPIFLPFRVYYIYSI
jgi:hypothetical protein